MKIISWKEQRNLGDRLTSCILNALGIPVEEVNSVSKAEFVGCGSMLEQMHKKRLTVWGSGLAIPPDFEGRKTDLRNCKVLCLRGRLSLEGCLVSEIEIPFGDPALLMSQIVYKSCVPKGTVIVPHWSDQERMRKKYPSATFVDVKALDLLREVEKIAGAEKVISSSLHGIILADTYNIPRLWDWFDSVQGGGFKFFDYGTSIGMHFFPGEFCLPPKSTIDRVRGAIPTKW